MNWTPPENEEARTELLSAYADGELSEAERAAVDRWLARDDARRRQLGELRAVSTALMAWPAPEPQGFVQPVRRRSRRRWIPVAAAFAAGLAVGVLSMTVQDTGQPRSAPQPMQAPVRTAGIPGLTPDKANNLIREAAAETMRSQIAQLIRQQKIDEAEDRLAALQRDYPDTHAAQAGELMKALDAARARARFNWRT